MNIRYIGSSSEVLIFWLLRLTPQCLSLHQQTINTPMKWAVYFMPSPLRWRKWFAIDTETQKNYVIGLIYKIKPCIYEYMRRFWVERKYSYRALHMHEKLTKCDAIYDRNFPRHDFFKALFLALSFSTSPSLIGRPITRIAQKFLSQLEQFLKTSISLKKNRRRKAKNYRDIAGGGKGREKQSSTSKAIVDMDCMEVYSSAGSLTGLSEESSSTSIIVVIWTTPDQYSF